MMRLICPKCDAQYNVADDAIPQGGRDVECSSCGNTWFQTPKPKVVSREVSRVLSTPMPSVVKTKSRDLSAYDTPQSGKATPDGPMHTPATDGPRHRPVDPKIRNILREEAARPRSAGDQGTKAPKTDRGGNPAEVAETRQRIAQLTGHAGGMQTDAPATAAAAVAPVATADPHSVPGLNEINAALRARAEANDQSGLTELDKHEAGRRRGFRRGFFIVLVLIALVVAPYIYAEQITQNMPELRGYMATYVAIIDQLRLSLDAFVGTVTAQISNLIG